MCKTADPVLLPLWIKCYGSTYHEVTGRSLVEKFTYFRETYTVGDAIEIGVTSAGSHLEVSLVAEIVSVGGNMRVAGGLMRTTRRALLLKCIRCSHNIHEVGEISGAFLWGDQLKRIRHSPLEGLART